jgi:dynein heavy chain
MNLQAINPFITKVLQLFDTLNVRFGSMIVGPSGSGKSQCYRVLAESIIHIK